MVSNNASSNSKGPAGSTHAAFLTSFDTYFQNPINLKKLYDRLDTIQPVKDDILRVVSTRLGRRVENKKIYFWHAPGIVPDERAFSIIDLSVEGSIRLTDQDTGSAIVEYASTGIRIIVTVESSYDLFYGWQRIDQQPRSPIASNSFSYTREFKLPLELALEWMKGELEAKEDPRLTLMRSSGNVLEYDCGTYPASLKKLFGSLGGGVFDWLKDQDFLDENSFDAIRSRLRDLMRPEPDRLMSYDDATQTDGEVGSVSTLREAFLSAENTEKFVELGEDDRRRLVAIYKTKYPHSIRRWAPLLGFKAGGSVQGFVKRMEEEDLLESDKVADGLCLVLTEKAVRILRSSP